MTDSNNVIENRASLKKLEPQINVKFEKVVAHSNNEGNNAADRLAEQGAKRHDWA